MAAVAKNFRPASVRVYVPELVPLIEPGGRICEYLDRCFDAPLLAPDGTQIPAGYYWTTCEQPVVHNYTLRGLAWDDFGQWEEDCCDRIDWTDGSNPCSSGCFAACPDPSRWWEFLPVPFPELPLLLVAADKELAWDTDNSLWWY